MYTYIYIYTYINRYTYTYVISPRIYHVFASLPARLRPSCRMPGRPSPPQRAGGAAGAGGSPMVPSGELMGKPWENPWENGESMGKPWKTHGKMVNQWENHRKTYGKMKVYPQWLTVCYWKWPIYSWYTNEKWWLSTVFVCFTRGYPSFPRVFIDGIQGNTLLKDDEIWC